MRSFHVIFPCLIYTFETKKNQLECFVSHINYDNFREEERFRLIISIFLFARSIKTLIETIFKFQPRLSSDHTSYACYSNKKSTHGIDNKKSENNKLC